MMIASASNEKIKEVKKLIKSPKKRREAGLFVVENIRMVREIPTESVRTIFVSESGEKQFREELDRLAGAECITVRDSVFSAMSDTESPQGILALVRMKEHSFEDILTGEEAPLVLVLESLQDPGNLGTILRTAEGAGVTGILLSSDSVDLYNPKVIRSTMGAVFRVPVYTSENLRRDVERLKERGLTVYGAHLDGEELYEKDFRGGCAFLIGNEGNGLSAELSGAADELLRIPMKGKVESLNAAISAAVLSYEALRQRK